MARLKITIPKSGFYLSKHLVSVGMVNYGGHLGNDAILTICQDARIQLFKSIKCSELDIGGVGVIQTETVAQYKAEGYLHNELDVETYLEVSSSMAFEITQVLKRGGVVIALVKTSFLAYDYGNKKIAKLPESFKINTLSKLS